MTLRNRVITYLAGKPDAKPSEVAKALGAVASSVRREMAQLKPKEGYKPKAFSVADQILDVIREYGAGEKVGMELLIRQSIAKGQYSTDELVQIANRKRAPQVSLPALYMSVSAPASEIRSRLSELVARGIVKRTEAGNYAIETAVYTKQDLPSSNRRAGFRRWRERDGRESAAVFDPKKNYKPKPMKRQKDLGNGRAYGISKSNLEEVPVLGLQVGKGYIVRDYDSNVPIDPSAIAMQRTARGYHLYFSEDNPGNGIGADEDYERISRERGIYQERLFERDGRPREKLIALKDEHRDFVDKHNEALTAAQKASIYQRFGGK